MLGVIDSFTYGGKEINVIQINNDRYFYHIGEQKNILIKFRELRDFLSSSFDRMTAKDGTIVRKLKTGLVKIDCLTFPESELRRKIRYYEKRK